MAVSMGAPAGGPVVVVVVPAAQQATGRSAIQGVLCRCAPPEFVTIGEGQARVMVLGDAERWWASTGFIHQPQNLQIHMCLCMIPFDLFS
jgi:hypothetical protein